MQSPETHFSGGQKAQNSAVPIRRPTAPIYAHRTPVSATDPEPTVSGSDEEEAGGRVNGEGHGGVTAMTVTAGTVSQPVPSSATDRRHRIGVEISG